MSLKSFLFEDSKQEEDAPQILGADIASTNTPDLGVDVQVTNVDTLLSDVYEHNNLANTESTIFKVETLSNTLPKEMPTDVKRTSVVAILSSFNLAVEDVAKDGDSRVQALTSAKARLNAEFEEKSTANNATIEDYKQKIADIEKEMANDVDTNKKSNEILDAETKRVSALISFILGGK